MRYRFVASVLVLFFGAFPLPAVSLDSLNALPSGHGGIVFTELPATDAALVDFAGARLMILRPDGSVRPLIDKFQAQADPEVSFDGKRILFSARPTNDANWQIFETGIDGANPLQITHEVTDCRSPIYQSQLFVLDAENPWYQISFVGGSTGQSDLYSCRPDGSSVRRLTYTSSGVLDPFLLPDGRVLFSVRERDRTALFGVNLDGTDYARFSGDEGEAMKRRAVITSDGSVVFIEPQANDPSGSGSLSSVSLRRNLHSYRKLTKPSDGQYYSVSPLPGGELLVSYRPRGKGETFGLYRYNPATKALSKLYGDPKVHAVQAKLLFPRPEPDGRSSVVDEKIPTGQLYGLSVYTTDLSKSSAWPVGSAKTLRVLERGSKTASGTDVNLEDDGSFNLQVPANVPLKLQVLDKKGTVLRSCSWIWVKNREARGCIGCHEDGERTPENVLAQALGKPAVRIPPEVPGGTK